MNGRFLPALLVLASLACADRGTMSESQCAAGDWQTVGYRDGAIGLRSTRLLAHQDACVPHDVIPQRDEYMLGWREGIREFCDPDNAFQVGRSGRIHHNVCPADQRNDFLAAYKEGRRYFLAEAAVLDLEARIQSSRMRLQVVKQQIVESATAQLHPVLTPAQRIELVAKVQRLDDERRSLEAEIPQLEAELALREEELEALSQSMAALTL
ncbi:MAG: DUF2799 domain-containing protein [Deltaproteobacteria bacterium]|jgi:ribosome modulation factor|nr:DUF2799 domain-containing protein [Deltaproteobacteria bacterium]MBW2498107.1 DUF2799 domain-containing protein [Deltaproteobacteria bacterium]